MRRTTYKPWKQTSFVLAKMPSYMVDMYSMYRKATGYELKSKVYGEKATGYESKSKVYREKGDHMSACVCVCMRVSMGACVMQHVYAGICISGMYMHVEMWGCARA